MYTRPNEQTTKDMTNLNRDFSGAGFPAVAAAVGFLGIAGFQVASGRRYEPPRFMSHPPGRSSMAVRPAVSGIASRCTFCRRRAWSTSLVSGGRRVLCSSSSGAWRPILQCRPASGHSKVEESHEQRAHDELSLSQIWDRLPIGQASDTHGICSGCRVRGGCRCPSLDLCRWP